MNPSYMKKFTSSKNIPESTFKSAVRPEPPLVNDRPFSMPYQPQEEVDYMQYWKSDQKAPYNLNTKVIFPRSAGKDRSQNHANMGFSHGEWTQQVPDVDYQLRLQEPMWQPDFSQWKDQE